MSLTVWLDNDMRWYTLPSGKRGRQQVFCAAAIQFCLSIKCLFDLTLRQKTLNVQLPYRASTGALELLAQTPPEEPLVSGSADGAYDSRACHEVIAQRGAQAVFLRAKTASRGRRRSGGASVRNDALKACARLGRVIWKKCSGYHRRSLVGIKMHCFKRLGERVMARTFERQVAELQVRVARLNRFTHLSRSITVSVAAMAWLRLGLGAVRAP